MIYPRFLDVEASSLGASSYPIEVAWSDSLGNIECHLINPYHIESWTDWDYNAQQIHGISRKMCRENGISPKSLCQIMSKSIAPNERVYADGGAFDEYWVDELYGAGSALGYAQFKISHSDPVMLDRLYRTESLYSQRVILFEKLKLEARKQVHGRHRAAVDVEYLIKLYELCVILSGSI